MLRNHQYADKGQVYFSPTPESSEHVPNVNGDTRGPSDLFVGTYTINYYGYPQGEGKR